VTVAQKARLDAYLREVSKHGATLRAQGWPVQLAVEVGDDLHPVVTLSLDVDDTRRPIESCVTRGGECVG
jgi:hypothetical protein